MILLTPFSNIFKLSSRKLLLDTSGAKKKFVRRYISIFSLILPIQRFRTAEKADWQRVPERVQSLQSYMLGGM
jgi:hypothetical protein